MICQEFYREYAGSRLHMDSFSVIHMIHVMELMDPFHCGILLTSLQFMGNSTMFPTHTTFYLFLLLYMALNLGEV